MTEAEYLSSTDPAAMRTLLVERGLWTEKKCWAFQLTCRWIGVQNGMLPTFWDDQLGGRDDGVGGWSNSFCDNVPNAVRASMIRDIWGNPFRNETINALLSAIKDDWLTYRNGLVPKLARAAVTRECERCGGDGLMEEPPYHNSKYPCPACSGPGTIPITGPLDPFRLAVLADALEEAGCTDEYVLGHLRSVEECPECSGNCGRYSYGDDPLNKLMHGEHWYPCGGCAGKGRRPIQHRWSSAGGCWVLDLIMNGGPAAVGQPPAHR